MRPSVKQRIVVFGVFVKVDKVHRHMIGLQRREQVDIFLAQRRIENVQSILFSTVSVHDQGIDRGGEIGGIAVIGYKCYIDRIIHNTGATVNCLF